MSETQATEVSGVFYLKTASLISAVGDAEGFRTAVFMIKIINLRQLNEGQFYNVSLNVEISDPYEPDRWVAQLHALDFSYGETPERLVFTWNDTIGSQRVRFLTLTASNVTPPEEDTACRATITAVGSGWVERAYVGALMNSYGTSIAFEDPHQYLVPGYDVDYRFLVANDGRLPDILDLNVSEVPENWTIKFYYQDGITPLNDTNNNGYPDTGVINGSQKMVLIARLKRSSPAPKGEIAKIWVTAISGIMPNQTSSTSLTGVIPGVFFSISDENLRNNGEHPYYGRKFSGHNVNPGENTTYVIKVFNMGSDNPPPVTLNIQDESIPEGWQAFLYFKGVASQTVIVTEEDIPEVGDHVEVLLYVTTPSSASEGDMAEIVVNRVETSEAARFIARVTLTRKVYIINLDGMPPEYVHQELMPNLWKLVEEGSYYTNASAHLIAATAINHVGIIVSADTQTHGILTAGTAYLGWNENRSMPEWRLYEYEDIPVETIYTTIKRSDPNLRTGVVSGKFWIAELFYGPDTDIKAHSYEHPFYIDEPQPYWLGDPNDPETDPTKHTRYISFAGAKGSPSDLYIVETAMEIIRNEDPDFLYVLLANPDVAGHSYGDAYDGSTEINPKANPEAMLDVIENITDKAVGAFMDFLKERGTYEDSIIAVTSDHSMDTMYPEIEVVYEDQTLTGFVHRAIDVREILENEGIVMGEDYEYGTRKGYVAMLYGFKNNETVQQAKSILENYKVIFTNVTGGISVYDENPIWAVLDRETMPEYRLYNELVISGATDREWPELIVLINEHYGGGIGAHGSHSTLPVTLVLHGPNIKKGYVNNVSVRTLDIVPTISRLNGWIYPDGHYFLDHEEEGTVLDCIVEDPIQNYTFQLEEGLNLISPLLTSKLYTAEFLAKAIPNSTSIAYWNSTIQDWVTHPVGTNVSNFKIIEGDALLVNVTAKTSFTIYGYLITEHKITLQTGWNGYGWLSDETITAKELKQIINKELDKPYRVTKVKMLNATTQTWIEYVRGEENNFPVIKGHGYLVYIEKTKGRGASGGGNRRLLR
jgi:predicted AlkP superfamily pyrophosphatase or phosphodiesterase